MYIYLQITNSRLSICAVLGLQFQFSYLPPGLDRLTHPLTHFRDDKLLAICRWAWQADVLWWDGLVLEESRKKLREIWLAIYWGSSSNRAFFMKCDLWGSLDLITSKRLHLTGTTISPATCKVSPPNPSPYTVQMSIFDFIRGGCWMGGCGCYIIKTPGGKRHDKGAWHGGGGGACCLFTHPYYSGRDGQHSVWQ